MEKWTDLFVTISSTRGCWRSSCTWSNSHKQKQHIDPSVGVGCPFCTDVEMVFHLFVQCSPLMICFHFGLLKLVKLSLLKCLYLVLVIQKIEKIKLTLLPFFFFFCLVQQNLLFGNPEKKSCWDRVLCVLNLCEDFDIFKGLVAAQLRIEHVYYKMVKCVHLGDK